ncbi:MAG: hypothetical protein HYU87_08095, partial [Chloroflexi bacterium]|nr:hypothetical protein [Chloroflexota bacterium]
MRQVRERRASPQEVVAACLARIERLEPRLHAFITVTADRALADARATPPSAALGGAPMAIKDL